MSGVVFSSLNMITLMTIGKEIRAEYPPSAMAAGGGFHHWNRRDMGNADSVTRSIPTTSLEGNTADAIAAEITININHYIKKIVTIGYFYQSQKCRSSLYTDSSNKLRYCVLFTLASPQGILL